MANSPKQRRFREAKSLRAVLKNASGRLVGAESQLAKIRAVYRAVVGPEEAASSLVLGVDGHFLTIAVATAETKKRLHIHESYILRMVRERCEGVAPTECRYRIFPGLAMNKPKKSPPVPRKTKTWLSDDDRKQVERISAVLSDPELRKRFADCMASALNQRES